MNLHSRSFASLPFTGSLKFLAIKYQTEVSGFSPVVLFQPLSLALHKGICSVCPLRPMFPDDLRLPFYGECFAREHWASRFRVNNKNTGLGSSYPPTNHHPRKCTYDTFILSAYLFGTGRISLFFAPYTVSMVAKCSPMLAIPVNPNTESVWRPRRLSALRLSILLQDAKSSHLVHISRSFNQ